MQQQQVIIKRRPYRKSERYHHEQLEEMKKLYDNTSIMKFLSQEKPKIIDKKIKDREQITLPIIKNYQNSIQKEKRQHFNLKQKKKSLLIRKYSSTFNQERKSPNNFIKKKGLVFVLRSSDQMIKIILERLGWKQSKYQNSVEFTLKWTEKQINTDYLYLKSGQYYNHIKGMAEIIKYQLLFKSLKNFTFLPYSYDLAKEYKLFCKSYDTYTVLILIKKHIAYFESKIKYLVDYPINTSIANLLRNKNFKQNRDKTFLINIPVMIQACIYCEYYLYELGYQITDKLQIKFDAKNIDPLIQYSKLDLPYELVQEFKYSYLYEDFDQVITSNIKTEKSTQRQKKINEKHKKLSALDTPSQQLVSLIVKYHNIFKNLLKDYESSGLHNAWYLIDKNNPYTQRRTIVQSKLLNTQTTKNYIIQKVIQKPFTIHRTKVLKIQTFAVVIFNKLNVIYYLNRHICNFEKWIILETINKKQHQYQKISENRDLQYLLKQLQEQKLYNVFQNHIRTIILNSLKISQLQIKNHCFQIIKFTTFLDHAENVWLQKVQNNVQFWNEYGNTELTYEMGTQFFQLLFNSNFPNRSLKYWQYLENTQNQKRHTIQSLKNSIISINPIKQNFNPTTIRNLAIKYNAKLIKQLCYILQVIKKKTIKYGRKKQSVFYACLASSRLQRIFKKHIKYCLKQMIKIYQSSKQDYALGITKKLLE